PRERGSVAGGSTSALALHSVARVAHLAVGGDPDVVELAAEELASRPAPLAVEGDVFEQEERRVEGDLVLPQLHRGQGEEALDVVPTEDDQTERPRLVG